MPTAAAVLLRLAALLAALLAPVSAAIPATAAPPTPRACDLSGQWHEQTVGTGTYAFTQTGHNFSVAFVPAAARPQQAQSGHWQKCSGTISDSGWVTLKTDTGHTLRGQVLNCSRIPWDHNPDGSEWCRVGAQQCPAPPPPPPRPPPPPPPPADTSIKRVHVVAMNHLDIGFSCEGCGGSATPRDKLDSSPAPYTWKLLDFYLNVAIPEAINTSRALAAAASNGSAPAASYVYTTHCWLVSFLLDCPVGWAGLRCPSQAAVADFKLAVKQGWIVWHAFPHNGEPETFDADLFGAGIDLCHTLDSRLGLKPATVLSQRDVPGMTRGVIPVLVGRGVKALSVGANGYSASAEVPRIYRWVDRQSGLSLIALQHPGGYGDGSTVTLNGSTHALHLLFNGDNAGPHSPGQVESRPTAAIPVDSHYCSCRP